MAKKTSKEIRMQQLSDSTFSYQLADKYSARQSGIELLSTIIPVLLIVILENKDYLGPDFIQDIIKKLFLKSLEHI